MPKAREIILGTPKRRPCSVTAIDGATRLDFALALLPSGAATKIAAGARAYAQGHGVTDPKPEDVLFLRGKWAHTLLLASVDPDSPPDKPEPYFDDVPQIERLLDDAAQIYIVQEQKDFQDEHAPLGEGLTPEEFLRMQAACVDEIRRAGDPDLPFSSMPLRILRSFCRKSVEESLALTEVLSLFGLLSPDASPSSPSTAPTSASEG